MSGEKEFLALGRKRYAIGFREGYSRYMWVYLLRRKSDAMSAFDKIICLIHVLMVRSRSSAAKVQDLCLKHGIQRDVAPTHSLQFSGSLKRGKAMIECESRSTRIQAEKIFHKSRLPGKIDHSWEESFNLSRAEHDCYDRPPWARKPA